MTVILSRTRHVTRESREEHCHVNVAVYTENIIVGIVLSGEMIHH